MSKRKRATPYAQKASGGQREFERPCEIQIVKTAAEKNKLRIELVTEEQLAVVKTTTAQNALSLFNDLIKEVQRRLPQMNDEVLTASLLSVWDKSGGGGKK